VIRHAEDDILKVREYFKGEGQGGNAILTLLDDVSSCYVSCKKCFLTFGRSGVVGFFLLLGMLLPVFAVEDYDTLIQRARGGDFAPALIHLRQAGNTASRAMQFDHILIASWADRPAEVIEVYNRLLPDADPPSAPLPAHVQQAVARAFRDMKRWSEAQAVWRLGLHQYPGEQAVFAAGLIMTLADAGQTQEAIDTGKIWVALLPNDPDIRMAFGYASQARQPTSDSAQSDTKAVQPAANPAQKPLPPKKTVQRAPQSTPQPVLIEDEYVQLLRQVAQSERALREARRSPKRFGAARIRTLEGDAAAFLTRLANMPAANENERFAAADRALARYDELIVAWTALGAPAADDLLRIRIDRLSALHARVRMSDLIHEYEQLLEEGVVVPMWALSDVASAHLYLRKPEHARDLYREILADMQANTPFDEWDGFDAATARLGNEIGLYYALTEAEQFNEIEPVLENIRNYAYEFLHVGGKPTARPNPHYLSAQRVLV